ncbi:DUF1349 domain-containing protein [Leucobacter japonicus]|uniref:DUF1349 domain-containing protein n=1 Tax=Leucobacter japonicus TaxID=1461259 RepID=UPI0009495732|nr:DUF1349 domain-containing protein [Leucobacter japonicus]
MTAYSIDGLPGEVTADGRAEWSWNGSTLAAAAPARTDLIIDPFGRSSSGTAPMARFAAPAGDFQFSARVTVDFASTFDAGVLLVWFDDAHWAKLCFEYSPTGQRLAVSVVTRGVSDDANAFDAESDVLWLRISRIDTVFAMHASRDGAQWEFVRVFRLDPPQSTEHGDAEHGDAARPQLGFLVRSPTGAGCAVRFDEIRFAAETLHDLRDGS